MGIYNNGKYYNSDDSRRNNSQRSYINKRKTQRKVHQENSQRTDSKKSIASIKIRTKSSRLIYYDIKQIKYFSF